MRGEGFDIRNLSFPRKGAHTSGICFAYLPSSTPQSEIEKLIARFNGHQIDEETSLLVMKSNRLECVYLGLKVDYARSKHFNEDRLTQVITLLIFFYFIYLFFF